MSTRKHPTQRNSQCKGPLSGRSAEESEGNQAHEYGWGCSGKWEMMDRQWHSTLGLTVYQVTMGLAFLSVKQKMYFTRLSVYKYKAI